MCCDAECGCGVEQLWMWNGVRYGLWLCDVEYVVLEMWLCEMVVEGRLRCNVMSDVEYGGPRRDVLRH